MRIKPFLQRLHQRNIFTLAASVSFFAFLSIFPFFLLVLSLAGLIINKETALATIGKILDTFPPSVAETLLRTLEGMISSSGVLSIISFLFLVVAALQMFMQLQHALHAIMGIPELTRIRPGMQWVKHLKLILFFLAFTLILLIMLLAGSTILAVLSKLSVLPFLRSYWVVEMGYVVLELLFFSFSYKWLAVHSLSWKSVFISGAAVTFLWELMKHLFRWYISAISSYSALYGSIGSLFLLQLWLFYSIFFYLVGAAICMELNLDESSK